MFIKSSKYISYAIPTPQIELLATIATSPAHRVPCLNSKTKQYIKLFQMNLIITCFHLLDRILDLDHHHYHLNHNWLLDHNLPLYPNYSIQGHHQELLL
jgi:hypothetical protein